MAHTQRTCPSLLLSQMGMICYANNHSWQTSLTQEQHTYDRFCCFGLCSDGSFSSTCRMSRLEESYKRKVDDITHESAQRAAEKEKQLQTEVQMWVYFLDQNVSMRKSKSFNFCGNGLSSIVSVSCSVITVVTKSLWWYILCVKPKASS